MIRLKSSRVVVDRSNISTNTPTERIPAMDYVLGFLSGSILTLASFAGWFLLLEWL